MKMHALVASTVAAVVLGSTAAVADSVADFYQGKSIRLVLPTSPGGSTSLFGLLMAEYLPRHIPGHPSMAGEYRVGAGGVVAANYVYNVAPKDGTVLAMQITNFITQDTQPDAVRFDVAKFSYIGRAADMPRALISWDASGLKSIEDVRKKEYIVGSSGRGSVSYIHPALLNQTYGARFKIIIGLGGAGDSYLALERREIDATTVAWDGLVAGRSNWLRDGKVNVLAKIGRRVLKGYEKVPSYTTLASNAEDKALLEFAVHPSDMGQVLSAPPGVPPERLTALRRAFDAMMKDPDFIKVAKDRKVVLEPMTGEELQSLVDGFSKRSKAISERLRAIAAKK
ncbi:MAG: Bug family tripartite tricarboxylate transporter substrate binding protein [Hyphomicrobiaceae bacterium]